MERLPASRRRSLILIALYYRIAGFERSIPFAGLALLLAALYGIATEQLSASARRRPASPPPARCFATGTVAALALALTFSLEKGWLTVALALMVPGIAWIANERPLPMLRWLAAAATVLVLARDRLGAAHRRHRRRHHADLQLDALRLRRAGGLVLGRRASAAQARRRHSRRAWSKAPRSCSPC